MKRFKIFTLFLFTIVITLSCSKIDTDQIRFAMAAARGDINLVKEFLADKSVNINSQNGEIGPALVTASYGGYKEIVILLLDNGADINIRDKRGTTPLMNAVINQKVEIVRLLLEKGADPNLVSLDENGKNTSITALTFAKMKQNKEIISLLEESSKSK